MHKSGKRPWKRLYRPLAFGAISSFLILCAACSAAPREATVALPPASLMEPIVIPDRTQARTQGDLVRLLIEDEATMERTNANLEALRQWRRIMEARNND